MKIKRYISYLIINIPVFIFFFLGLFFLTASLMVKNLWLLIGVWWALSGAIMLIIDFIKRKRDEFFRLLLIFEKDKRSERLKNNLKQTICGLCILLALKYRLKNGI